MRLSALLAALPDDPTPRKAPTSDPVIRGISYDSRGVSPGDLFVALVGAVSDGHDYLAAALELGAAALLVEDETQAQSALAAAPRSVPILVVPDSRRAMGPISARFFGDPADELVLVGITGTNGKTSTSYLIESILARRDPSIGLIGTVEIRYANERLRAVNTTPESLDLQRILRSMRTHGISTAVMEVSSHGLELGRVGGCRFRAGAITNVTQDHLDFHGSMEAYLESKLRLFRHHLTPDGVAVINIDDSYSRHSLAAAKEAGVRVIRATRRSEVAAEVKLLEAEVTLTGSRVRLQLPAGELSLELPLLGDFNLENLVVACGLAAALEVPLPVIAEGVARCPQVPGRMELIGSGQADLPTVIVDYAHTPDAVDKLLAAVDALAVGRLITVFGCGGDRDRTKRPRMAQAVAKWSHCVIATSDNPRTEEAGKILKDVEVGLSTLRRVEPENLAAADGCYAVEIDRRRAIDLAISIARAEDTVVLAGKGHEDYQIIGHDKLPFDDREEAARALATWVQPR
jgi:UDP-N-acetylmuramoyl-L-alanyl-D-glutamate--2,6-diaminopimelate ligase